MKKQQEWPLMIFVKAHGVRQAEVARVMGVSRQAVNKILTNGSVKKKSIGIYQAIAHVAKMSLDDVVKEVFNIDNEIKIRKGQN